MSEWDYAQIGDLYDVHNGLSKGRERFGSGFPFVTFKDVFDNYFLPHTVSGLVESDEKEQVSYSILRGDVLITRTSETYDELGMSSVALQDYPEATYNGFCKRLRPKTEDILPEFIGYYLRSPMFRNGFQQFSAMTTRASLKNENLLTMTIPVPPLVEQQAIAEVLGAYDDLIENNRKQIKLLEEAASHVYRDWLEGCDASTFKLACIKDYFDASIEKTPPRKQAECFAETGIPWASVKDLGKVSGGYLFSTSECLTEEAVERYGVKVLPMGTIMLSFKLTIGRIAIASQPIATNEAIAHFVTDNDALRLYAYEYLSHYDFNSLGSTSSIGKAINSKIVKAIPFALPKDTELDSLHKSLAPIFRMMKNKQKMVAGLTEARDRLLPKLMSGEIEV